MDLVLWECLCQVKHRMRRLPMNLSIIVVSDIVSAQCINYIGYYNTNKAADDLVDESLVVPDSVTKGEIVQNVSQEAEQEYNKIWTEFKAACD